MKKKKAGVGTSSNCLPGVETHGHEKILELCKRMEDVKGVLKMV